MGYVFTIRFGFGLLLVWPCSEFFCKIGLEESWPAVTTFSHVLELVVAAMVGCTLTGRLLIGYWRKMRRNSDYKNRRVFSIGQNCTYPIFSVLSMSYLPVLQWQSIL